MLLIRCFARSPLPLGILLILLLALAPVRAGVAAEAMLNGQGILWEIAQEGQTPNYLLGTIHIADERVLTLPPPVGAAFAASQRAIFEIIFDPSVRTTIGCDDRRIGYLVWTADCRACRQRLRRSHTVGR